MHIPDGARLAEALTFAAKAHEGQTRKNADVPYLCHPLGVAASILELEGDTEQAIAGLLHDVLEDSPTTSEELEALFGARVARMVRECSDTLPGDSPSAKSPWKERKQAFLQTLNQLPPETLLIIGCDKLHNLRAMVGTLRVEGFQALSEFKGTPRQQVTYYENALRRLAGRVPLRLQLDLQEAIEQLRGLIQGGDTQKYGADETRPEGSSGKPAGEDKPPLAERR